jgi:hypothetical protein
MDPFMSIVHLLIFVVPSFAAGLVFGRSHLTGAYWGIAAEALGLLMVALPISSGGGPRNGLSLSMIGVSLVLGAIAGALGFGALRLVKSLH